MNRKSQFIAFTGCKSIGEFRIYERNGRQHFASLFYTMVALCLGSPDGRLTGPGKKRADRRDYFVCVSSLASCSTKCSIPSELVGS